MIKNYLKSLNIFESLTEDEIENLSFWSKERVYKKGSIIVSEGNKRNFIYIVKKGKVKLYKSSSEGRHIILELKGENSILGLVILFTDLPNPTTIMTLEDSTIYLIRTPDLESLVLSNSDFAAKIIKILGVQLLNSQNKVKDVTLDDSYTKTLKLLYYLSKDFGLELDNGLIELNLDLTRSDMASIIGVSRETLSRTLSQLNKQGIILIDENKIFIADESSLKS